MDIMVQGEGKKFYKPNEVEISLNFHSNDTTYEKVLDKGTKDVELFISNVLGELNIKKDELKTRNFRIFQNIRYDYEKKKNVDLGYDYTQAATLKMDYDMAIVADFMEKVAKLKNPPKYTMNFSIKDKEAAKKEVMAEAYTKAKDKAEIIALAAGKTLKDCVKVDFRPFETAIQSRSSLSDNDFSAMCLKETSAFGIQKSSAKDVIQTIFTPEDVEIRETLYCLWITE